LRARDGDEEKGCIRRREEMQLEIGNQNGKLELEGTSHQEHNIVINFC